MCNAFEIKVISFKIAWHGGNEEANHVGGTAKVKFCTEIAAGTIILDSAANVEIHL